MTQVQKGQIWKDCDKRMGDRYLRVERVDRKYGYCVQCQKNGQRLNLMFKTPRETRIMLKRFRPTSTGFELIREADAE